MLVVQSPVQGIKALEKSVVMMIDDTGAISIPSSIAGRRGFKQENRILSEAIPQPREYGVHDCEERFEGNHPD